LNDHVHQAVTKDNPIEVRNVTLQLIVERDVAQRKVDVLSCLYWLLRQDDLLDLRVYLQKDLNIWVV